MKIRVLGAAAGGGFPQWNCACHNCRGLRDGSVVATPRTQSSIAVSPDGASWVLVNASPDILQQLRDFPAAWPGPALRGSGLKSVLLVDGQIDHTTGLYMLREHNARWPVWATPPVHEDLTRGNPLLKLLEHYCGVDWHPLPSGRPCHCKAPRLPIPPTAGRRSPATTSACWCAIRAAASGSSTRLAWRPSSPTCGR
jgi:pyrroloquinoline quinone biosynthesis protein B